MKIWFFFISIIIFIFQIGPKGEPVNIKLFPQPSGDYTGEFTPTKIGKLINLIY
jgi:hypothetical protein